MAWNGSGTYVLSATYYPEVNGTVIDAARYNGLMSDLATGVNNALAKNGENAATANIPMGGFKFTGLAAGSAAGNSVRMEQVFIQSTGTVALAASTSNIETPLSGNVLLDGTGITVTAFAAGSAAGVLRLVRFNGVNTLTHASTFSLPGSVNITTASGDCAWVESTASGWAFRSYARNSGTALYQQWSDGTVSAPGASFSSDTNTGFYRIGADSFGVAAGGVNIATLSNAGITITGGTVGNDITISTTAGSAAATGDIVISTGAGTNVASGDITIQTGDMNASSGEAGDITIACGAGVGSSSTAGDITITAGSHGGDDGGNVIITGGESSSSGASDFGGDVRIYAGRNSAEPLQQGEIILGRDTSDAILYLDKYAHWTHATTGYVPTLTSGGGTGGTITGTDNGFRVTLGTSPGTSVVVTFDLAYDSAPMAFVNYGASNIAVRCVTTTTTCTITFASTPANGATVDVICQGLR